MTKSDIIRAIETLTSHHNQALALSHFSEEIRILINALTGNNK